MKIKLDENLGERGAALFQTAGHDVATVAGQGMSSAADGELLAACRAEKLRGGLVRSPHASRQDAGVREAGKLLRADVSDAQSRQCQGQTHRVE